MKVNSNNPIEIFENKQSTFQAIFQTSNEGIIVVNATGQVQLINPTAEKMFGYENNELKGKNMDILVPDTIRGNHQNLRDRYIKNPDPRPMGLGRDLEGQRKDGSCFPLEVSLSNTYIENKQFVVAFIIDISRRKKAEEALKRSEEQLITYASELEQRVKKRTEDLKASIDTLESTNKKLKKAEKDTRMALSKERELNELKSRFVSMASHEFRTPLSSILSSVSLIDKYISANNPEKTVKHIDRIKSSVKNLTDILNDFLSLGKLEEGKIDVHPERVDLNRFLIKLNQELEGLLKPGQHFLSNVEHALEIVTDERLLRNMLTNLISNASKYSSENKPIEISCFKDGNQVIFQVKDYGMGIPLDEQEHMFERFYRAKNAMNIQGTGLGLNIVNKYLEILGGSISFESILNEGTVFIFKLPHKFI